MDLLYLVVDGNFTPLLGSDACLDLEVLKFMNLQLIDSPEPDHATPKTIGSIWRPDYVPEKFSFTWIPRLFQ